MEDNTTQPPTADASLYNGQPTDTGSSCPSARLTSCTPSIQENKGGVSVENVPIKNSPLVISDTVMDNFIHLTSLRNPHIIPVTSENIKYKLGDEVVITEGEFKDIRGRVARIAGQQRAVVELLDGCLVAMAYVPKKAMRKINNIKGTK